MKIVDDGQHFQGLGRETSSGMMQASEIAITPFDGEGGALIMIRHPTGPINPSLAFLGGQGLGQRVRQQFLGRLVSGLLVADFELTVLGFIALLEPVNPGQ